MVVPESLRLQHAGLYLMRLVRADSEDAERIIAEGESLLEPVLEWLVTSGYATVTDAGGLRVSPKGASVAAEFERRYQQFVADFDVFCAVDLEAGEFAFENYDDFPSRAAWEAYLEQDRFDDLRVAIAQFKGFDPLEAVLMSFVEEGRFGYTDDGWAFDTLLGNVWEDIADVCENAVQLADLAFESENGPVSAEAVAEDIVERGRAIVESLRP